MKILDKKQLKAWDQETINCQEISSTDLMLRASTRFVEKFTQLYSNRFAVLICCGIGNNGGDGIVIGRLLADRGYQVDTVLFNPEQKQFSADLSHYLSKYADDLSTKELEEAPHSGLIDDSVPTVLIDALFGYGFEGNLSPAWLRIVQWANEFEHIVSVDMPSGISCDAIWPLPASAIEADHTISFETVKLPFLLPEYERFVGQWHIVNIGLEKSYPSTITTDHHLLLIEDFAPILSERSKYGHKGNYGHGLLIAGGYGKIGACSLSARAALRAGLGLLTVYLPKCGYNIIQTVIPEAMVITDEQWSNISSLPTDLSVYQSVAIGPGMSDSEETLSVTNSLINSFSAPIIIDADALNAIAKESSLLPRIPKFSILTPHPKEFDRLFGDHACTWDRIQTAHEHAQKNQLIFILKGGHTAIILPDGRLYFNSSGNPGMATGGSGDALTGILLGLLCQGYRVADAAILGVYLHGLAADIALENNNSVESLLPSDIIAHVGKAFQYIRSTANS